MSKRRLGVNIDHIATLRQARRSSYPNPADSIHILNECGVDQVTIHLREDRRHIQDHDLAAIRSMNILPVNLEMAVTDEMVAIALREKPHTVTFVPEKREEITTEGGLDCILQFDKLASATRKLQQNGIRVSLFIDAEQKQVQAAKDLAVEGVEFHTGAYCHLIESFYENHGHYRYSENTEVQAVVDQRFEDLKLASQQAANLGLDVFAGHGLHCQNLARITGIREISEYNIGHSIIARSVFVGLKAAIQEIQSLLAS